MKNIIVVFLVLVAISLSSCGSSDSPSAVLENWTESVNGEKVDDAFELLSTNSKELFHEPGGMNDFERVFEYNKIIGGIKDYKVKSEDIDGDMAKLTVEVVAGNGEVQVGTYNFIKEADGWRLNLIK